MTIENLTKDQIEQEKQEFLREKIARNVKIARETQCPERKDCKNHYLVKNKSYMGNNGMGFDILSEFLHDIGCTFCGRRFIKDIPNDKDFADDISWE